MKLNYSKLIKAASLILANQHSSKILFIKRPQKVAFANVYAFPGGVLNTSQDIDLTKTLITNPTNEQINKITALRETFEEVGILTQKPKNFQSFDHFITQSTPDILDNLHPFIRLITVPYLPKRYDAYFYIHICDNDTFNYNSYIHDKDPYDLDQLFCDTREVVSYEWLTPQQCLRMYYQKQIELAPPQIIMLNYFSAFSNISDALQYLQDSKTLAPFQIYLQKNKKNHKYPLVAYNLFDNEYPLEYLINHEKDDDLINDLKCHQSDHQNWKNRFYFNNFKQFFDEDFDVEVDLPFKTPFNKLLNYQNLMKQLNI